MFLNVNIIFKIDFSSEEHLVLKDNRCERADAHKKQHIWGPLCKSELQEFCIFSIEMKSKRWEGEKRWKKPDIMGRGLFFICLFVGIDHRKHQRFRLQWSTIQGVQKNEHPHGSMSTGREASRSFLVLPFKITSTKCSWGLSSTWDQRSRKQLGG